MAKFPFVYNYNNGRNYYGSALESNKNNTETWTRQSQKPIVSDKQAWRNFGITAGVAGTVGAIGFLPTKTGNIWDKYIYGIRAFEEFSPGGVFRTLQLSNIFSPLTGTARQANLFISPQQLANNYTQLEYLSRLIGGKDVKSRLFREGVTLQNRKLLWGTGTEVALPYAGALLSQGHGTAQRIGAAYARNLNVRSNIPLEHFFANINPRQELPDIINPSIKGQAAQIIGGKNRLHAAYRYAAAIGTEQVARFNRLLNAQFDIPVLNLPLKKAQQAWTSLFGRSFSLGVKETGGLRMFTKLGLKYGIGLTGLMLGYQTLDWSMRENELFNDTIFDEGLTVAGATIGVKANLAASRLAETFGLHDYREKQESIAPGSTSLTKLAAFPVMGALAPVGALYGYKTAKMAGLIKQGLEPAIAREAITEQMAEWSTPLLKNIKDVFDKNKILSNLTKLTPGKAGAILGAGIGAAMIAPFLPGALISSERPEELEALYRGEKEVPIRKGRWWLMGRTPYEGRRIETFLPHWYPRMRMRSKEIGIWGEEDVRELSPLERWWKAETSYYLERKHYFDRPYPQTGVAFEEVPLIGPILGATIGRLIKPPVPMHQEEYIDEAKGFKLPPGRFGEKKTTEEGETIGGTPVSAYDPTQVLGRQIYNFTEAFGLTGFLSSSIKERLTGSQDWFDQYSQMESSRRLMAFERSYWDRELGDVLGLSEAFRRLYPHRQRQIEQINPIKNEFYGSWLPGPGERSENFWYGDPMSRIPWGEYRLPGPGLEKRYPELEGLDISEYPSIFRYKILSDIAPYSESFKEAEKQVRRARKQEDWSDRYEGLYQEAKEQMKAKKESQKFQEYQYLSSTGGLRKDTPGYMSQVLAEINERQAQGNKPNESNLKNIYGSYWELLSHNAETALDQLTPLSPGAKLVHQRTAIEAYERQQLYGSEAAFWQHPIKDFLAPFARSAAHTLGWEGVTTAEDKERNLKEYFDVLKYVKATRLANIARSFQDEEAVKEFERKKDETLFGINPFTRNYRSLYRSLPRSERDYFKAFEEASTLEERTKILKMVPNNEKGLYLARWKLVEADQLRKARKKGILSEEQLKKADEELDAFYKEAHTEGFPSSKELFAEYSATRMDGENYADWYRRTYLLPKYNIPGADWVGFSPQVDLEDIKLKVVQEEGLNMFDFNLWPSRERQLPYKEYIDEEAIEPILSLEKLSEEERRAQINDVLAANNIKAQIFSRRDNLANNDTIEIDVEQDRSKEIKDSLLKALS